MANAAPEERGIEVRKGIDRKGRSENYGEWKLTNVVAPLHIGCMDHRFAVMRKSNQVHAILFGGQLFLATTIVAVVYADQLQRTDMV